MTPCNAFSRKLSLQLLPPLTHLLRRLGIRLCLEFTFCWWPMLSQSVCWLGYRLGSKTEFNSWQGQIFFSSPQFFNWHWGLPEFLSSGYQRFFPWGEELTIHLILVVTLRIPGMAFQNIFITYIIQASPSSSPDDVKGRFLDFNCNQHIDIKSIYEAFSSCHTYNPDDMILRYNRPFFLVYI
jgi:hypothetical protein